MRLQLTFAGGSYDFVRPLAEGTIRPDGIDLVVLSGDPWEFGLTDKNRQNLETLQRYCAQQGIVRKARPLEELFIDAGRVNIPEEI